MPCACDKLADNKIFLFEVWLDGDNIKENIDFEPYGNFVMIFSNDLQTELNLPGISTPLITLFYIQQVR